MKRGLSTLRPLVSNLPPRMGYAEGDERAADRHRDRTSPWRAWYRTARWQRLRQEVLVGDMFTCQMCGRLSDTGMVVDHVEPHRGDEALFWDDGNLQVLCASPCHSKHKQALEANSHR